MNEQAGTNRAQKELGTEPLSAYFRPASAILTLKVPVVVAGLYLRKRMRQNRSVDKSALL